MSDDMHRMRRSPWAMGVEWLLVTAGLPVALPVGIAVLFYWLAAHSDPLHHFLDQGDFLLATTVLASAVIYDISDALNAGRVTSKFFTTYRIIFWIIAAAVALIYVVLRCFIELDANHTHDVSTKTAYIGLISYGCTAMFSLGIRVHAVREEMTRND